MPEPEIQLLPILADPRRIALDVGANVGDYAEALLPLCREVHLFEPVPELAHGLEAKFGPPSVFYPAAVSDRVGVADLQIPHLEGQGEWHPLATIDQNNDLSGLPYRRVRVMTCTIDSLQLDDIGLIKIDTEGHELSVLKGASSTLLRYRPNLIVEAEERHRPDAVASVVEFLQDFGYKGIFRSDEYNHFLPAESFIAERHQAHTKLGSMRYCSNFIFGISIDILQRCSSAIIRSVPENFDRSGYLLLNPDVAARRMDPVEHYMVHGWLEGRKWRA